MILSEAEEMWLYPYAVINNTTDAVMLLSHFNHTVNDFYKINTRLMLFMVGLFVSFQQ